MKKKQKKRYLHNFKLAKKFATTAAFAVTALGLAQPVFTVLNPTVVQADEVKSGEQKNQVLNFATKSREVINEQSKTTVKPLDLILIIDGSGSMLANGTSGNPHYVDAINDSIKLIESLPNGSRVMITSYLENQGTSYRTNRYSKMLAKSEAITMLKDFQGFKVNYDWYRSFEPYAQANPDKFLTVVDREYEDAYKEQANKLETVSVIQFTDEWTSRENETIDTSFAEWAKSNAKTFMSVVYPDKNKASNPLSISEMKKIGHPNIYNAQNINEEKRQKDIIEQFKNTATEKIVNKSIVHPKGEVTVIAEADIAISSAHLVSPSGKKVSLTIKEGKGSWTGEFTEDGEYKVEYTFSGTSKEIRKITGTVLLDGKEAVSKMDTIIPEIVKGTRTEEIPFETIYQEDPELTSGEEKEIQAGVEGERTIHTEDDKEVSNEVTTSPVNRIIARGTKGTDVDTKTEKIPFETKYQDDDTLEAGQEKVLTEGTEGEKTITTTYVTQKGERAGEPVVEEKVTKEKVDKVIARGTKGSDVDTKTEKIPFETKYQDDPTLPKGQEKVLTEGVEGEKTITSTYATQKGERVGDPVVEEKVTKEKVDKVVARGMQEAKTVSYKVVDAADKTKELVKLTKVSEGYTGDKYKIDLPKLDGYTVKAPENVKLEGEIADKDIVVEFLAEPVKKVGKDVILKFEDTNGKKIAEDKVIAHEKEIGTDFEDKAPETLKVGDQTYQFTNYKDNVKEVKGKVTDQEQVFTAIYSAPKQQAPQGVLPNTGTTVSIGLSILGFIGLVTGGTIFFLKNKNKSKEE